MRKPQVPAAGGNHYVLRHRDHHLHYEADDVARRAELAAGARGDQLAQHVLVDVALGVAVVHGHAIDESMARAISDSGIVKRASRMYCA
jgi:hypothetical protein